jgi:hypothetical protein
MVIQTPMGSYYQTGNTIIPQNVVSPRNHVGYRPVSNDQQLFTDPALLTMMRQDVQRILSKSQLKNKENVQPCGGYK